MSMTREIVRKRLSELELKRWDKIMVQIEAIQIERLTLMAKLADNTKRGNVFFKQMAKFWELKK